MALPETTPTPIQAPAEVEGYCVKCKATRKMSDVQVVTAKNGRPTAKGKCPVCGTTMNKFLSTKTG